VGCKNDEINDERIEAMHSEQFETGQLRALVENFRSAKLDAAEEMEPQQKRRMPGFVSEYDSSTSESGFSGIFQAITGTFSSLLAPRSVSCQYNGHRIPKRWKGEFPRCEQCDKLITCYEESRPIHNTPQHSGRYWTRNY